MSDQHAWITVDVAGHGHFEAPAFIVDLTMNQHLPASPLGLRATVAEQTGTDWADVCDVSTFIVVLSAISWARQLNEHPDWLGAIANTRTGRTS